MAKRRETLELDPQKTLIVFSDPMRGFTHSKSSYVKRFGIREVAKIRAAITRSQQFVDQYPEGVPVVYVRSEYQKGQFTDGDLEDPLATLCVPGSNADCEWANGVTVPQDAVVITKHTNDAWQEETYRNYITTQVTRNAIRHLILCGCTTTTCVKQTSISTQRNIPDLQVIVPLGLVGCRLSKYEKRIDRPTLIEEAVEEMRRNQIRVLSERTAISWKSNQDLRGQFLSP